MYKNLVPYAPAGAVTAELSQRTFFAAPRFRRRRALGAMLGASLVPATALAQVQGVLLKVGFLYVTPVLDAGWTRQHDDGRKAMEAALGARIGSRIVENVAEGPDAERVLRSLVSDGCGLIFATSFGYMEPLLKVAGDHPQVRFESITGFKRLANVATANARYYEGRYLAGMAAGRLSRSGVAGYVAGFPIPEVIQGVNAFTLGIRSVNPQAQVRLVWLNAWFDPPREREAAQSVANQGADVLAFHVASTAAMTVAQERGLHALAYHSDMSRIAPQAQALAVTHHWGDYYTERARAVLDGRWQSIDTWGGIAQGMVRVGHFGPKVPQPVRDEIVARQRDIASGRLVPFKAGTQAILDQDGRPRVASGQALDDAQILGMNWLVQGVVGTGGK